MQHLIREDLRQADLESLVSEEGYLTGNVISIISNELFAHLHIERETLEGKFAVFIQDRLRLRLLFYFYLRPSPSASMRVPHSEAQSLERWRLRDRLYAAEMRVTCLQRR